MRTYFKAIPCTLAFAVNVYVCSFLLNSLYINYIHSAVGNGCGVGVHMLHCARYVCTLPVRVFIKNTEMQYTTII